MTRSFAFIPFAGRALRTCVLTLPLWFLGGPAHALSISKTLLEIDAASVVRKHETFITVSNEKTVPVFVSSTIQSWKVGPDGRFELAATDEVTILAPGPFSWTAGFGQSGRPRIRGANIRNPC